jgi:predicted TIM-barrel fold metal-dependent hydrolase
LIIDFHTHIFPPEIVENRGHYLDKDDWFRQLYSNPEARLVTAESLVAEMDSAGVDVSVTFGFAWADLGLCRAINDYILEAVARYPDRLIGFVSVNPCAGREAVKEVVRCAEWGMRGIGELMPDGQGFCLDDETIMAPLVEVAANYNLIIQSHITEPVGHGYPGKGTLPPWGIVRLAELFPQATFVCAHWGGGLLFYELMPELKKTLRHVYYDTAASLYLYQDQIFPLAAQIAEDKILFATDYPLIGQKRFLAHIRRSGMPEGAQAKLLGSNAARLLGL